MSGGFQPSLSSTPRREEEERQLLDLSGPATSYADSYLLEEPGPPGDADFAENQRANLEASRMANDSRDRTYVSHSGTRYPKKAKSRVSRVNLSVMAEEQPSLLAEDHPEIVNYGASSSGEASRRKSTGPSKGGPLKSVVKGGPARRHGRDKGAIVCYFCRGLNHYARECPKKNRAHRPSEGRGGRGGRGRGVKSRLGHQSRSRESEDRQSQSRESEDLERQFTTAKDDIERGIQGIKAAKKAAAIIGKNCSFQASKKRRLD